MRVVARVRKPGGELLRLTYRADQARHEATSSTPARAEVDAGAENAAIMTWWDRWWLAGALERTGYQRLF